MNYRQQHGYSIVLIVSIFFAVAIISLIGFFVVSKNRNNTLDTTKMTENKSSQSENQSSNQTTVQTIEQDINNVNLENELPSEDLEQDINSLL